MCHAASQQIFNLECADRNLEKLQDFYRKEWDIEKQQESYKALFLNEREWVLSGLRLLQNYVELEDPRQIASPNPVKQEVWARAFLNVTGCRQDRDASCAASGPDNTFLVRGTVDCQDNAQNPCDHQEYLRLVHYKTGKAPPFKYSRRVNEQITKEMFFQLKSPPLSWCANPILNRRRWILGPCACFTHVTT